jgi:transcriptional regulator with PAS, ATPase and Fis domain
VAFSSDLRASGWRFNSQGMRKMLKNSESILNSVGIIGDSPAIQLLACQIETAARSDLTALVTGESGTGKELVARAIHQQSARAERPFISLNCGALTETLLESELFGYVRGAFTGAHQKHQGLFEAAHTGTIFLDEIGEMSSACQVKLLRVLQENAVRPIGAHTENLIDVRVIAATNRNLAHEIAVGRFRQDLFYRIAVLTISTPALRERSCDIPLLTQHFLWRAEHKMKCQHHGFEEGAIQILSGYFWPGNVRQLRHVVEKLAATANGNQLITVEAVRRALPDASNSTLFPGADLHVRFCENDSLDDFLDRTMLNLYSQLRQQTGTHSQAARLLRIDRVSLYQRLERARRRIQVGAGY